MPPPTLALERPSTLDETVAILAGDVEARVLAGGQSLIPLLTLGFAAPDVVVSLDRCEGLGATTIAGNVAHIGAMVTTRHIELDTSLATRCPLLATAAGKVGSPHVRNFGTLVGNLCHADPGSDLIPAALCLDAEVEVRSTRGDRRVMIAELIEGPFITSLEADEMATAVRVPFLDRNWQHGYRKLTLRAGDLAVATAAVLLRPEGGRITDARVVVGGALRRARRISRLEAALAGVAITEAASVAPAVNWIEDLADDLLPDTSTPRDYLQAMLPRFVAATVRDAVNPPPRRDR